MIDLQVCDRRAALERQLQLLRRIRTELDQSHRSILTLAPSVRWSGFARWRFNNALQDSEALWSETRDVLYRAEHATRGAIDELDNRGE